MGISDDFLSAGEEEEELYPATETVAGRRADRKRRFSEEQIKSLESIFESQAKLEPCKKLQLARELGLQPRQVAIWFQNKRARWKSKQLERQYEALRADYDVLLSSFATLKKEKHILVKQVQKLAELLKRPCGESGNCGDLEDKIGKGKENMEEDEQPGFLLREEEDIKLKYACSQEETDLLNCWGEPAGTSSYFVNSAAPRSCFDNGGCSPEKSCTATPPKWWEFWPISD